MSGLIHRIWTRKEDELVLELYSVANAPALASTLGRTPLAIARRASRLRCEHDPGRRSRLIRPRCELRVREITRLVAGYYSLAPEIMTANSRVWRHARPRMMLIALLVEFTNVSLAQLGRELRRDHTSIIHADRRIRALIGIIPKLAEDFKQLQKIIRDAICVRVAERMSEEAWAEFEIMEPAR